MRCFAHILSVTVALAMFPTQGFAQDAPLTLSRAVALAQKNAPASQGAAAAVRAAEASVELAQLRPNPTLNLEAANVLGSGRYGGFGAGDKTYSVAVPLELGGKRDARVRVAQAERTYAGVGAAVAKAEVTLKITQAFIAIAASERRLEIAENEVELAERAAHAASERVRSGKASPIEDQRAQVILGNAQIKRGRIARAQGAAARSLARLLDLPVAPAIAAQWFDDIGTEHPVDVAAGLLPVAAADAQIAIAQARVDAARRARIPDVTVSAGMRRIGDTGDSAAVLSLSVPVPLFNRGHAELARTRAELDRTEADRRTIAKESEQAIEMALADVADTLAAATSSRGPVLAAATEAARIARIGYAAGKFSQLELIEAERALAETRASAIDAMAALHDARARLARLQGSTAALYKD